MLANEEFAAIRSRTMGGKERLLSKGLAARGGRPAYGYTKEPVNGRDRKEGFALRPHPEHAENLRKILGWFIEGGYTYAARMATEAKIPTPMARTTKRKNAAKDWTPWRWSPVSVQHLVDHAAMYVTGEIPVTFDGTPYVERGEPLIDHATLGRVEAKVREGTLKRRATFLSTSFLQCSCGAPIFNRAFSRYNHTRCDVCRKSIRQIDFDARLFASLVCRLIQIQMAPPPAQAKDHGERLADARERLDTVTAKIEKLLDLHLEGGLDRDAWKGRNERLNAEKVSILGEMERIRRDEADAAKRQGQEVEVVARIAGTIHALMVIDREDPEGLATVRTILGELLGGQRLTVRWDTSEAGRTVPMMTWPAWGTLPAITVKMTERQWPQMLPDHTPDVVPSWDP
jgi:hypothetical protein